MELIKVYSRKISNFDFKTAALLKKINYEIPKLQFQEYSQS